MGLFFAEHLPVPLVLFRYGNFLCILFSVLCQFGCNWCCCGTSSLSSSMICSFSVSVIAPMTIQAIVSSVSSSQSRDLAMMGRNWTSMIPSFHPKFGLNLASQGYPRITSLIPRSVTKNLILDFSPFTWMFRSMKSVIIPALLVVPSMFQIFQGSPNFWVRVGSIWSFLDRWSYRWLQSSPGLFCRPFCTWFEMKQGLSYFVSW